MKLHKIRTNTGGYRGERMTIKGFKTQDAMYKFLNHGSNSLAWREVSEKNGESDLKPGKYAWAGGQWHNVRSLDPSVLAHI